MSSYYWWCKTNLLCIAKTECNYYGTKAGEYSEAAK